MTALASLPKPHRICAFRGATAADVQETIFAIDGILEAAKRAVVAHLQNLRTNLPLDVQAPSIESFQGTLDDLRSDLLSDLRGTMDEMEDRS